MKVLDEDQIKALQIESFKKKKGPLETVDGQRVKRRLLKEPESKPIPPVLVPTAIDFSMNINAVAGAILDNTETIRVNSNTVNQTIREIPRTIDKVLAALPKPIRKWKIKVLGRDPRGHIEEIELLAE